MNWLLIAMIAPFLWAISNFIDKFLVSKYFKSNTGTLIIYSCLIGFPVALLIALFKPEVLSLNLATGILLIINGFLFILYLFPYLKALSKADTSVVVPIFQSVPVFSYFLAYFVLGEFLSFMQIIGSLLIIFGAIGISTKFSEKKIHLTKDILFLQLLASLLVALNTLFLQYTGFVIFGFILLFFVKSYRLDFIISFKRNKGAIISLNVLNEIINIIGVIIFSYATLLAPLTLVWVINGLQPVFVFFIGILLTIFFPHLIKEELNRKILLQKILFILIMFIGAYLLNII